MKVLFLDTDLIISVVPRVYPLISDTITIELRNESTNVAITPEIEFTVGEFLTLTVLAQPNDFKAQNKYEFAIKNDGQEIYLGKLIVLKEGTDVQNYEYKTQNNEYFKFKE